MDYPWEELGDEENCPTWIAPHGTTSVDVPLRDDPSAQSSGDETIINEPPEEDQLPSQVSGNNLSNAVVERRDEGRADKSQQSRSLYQYRQQYSFSSRPNCLLEPYKSSKQIMEIPIDPVLLNHDKMASQSFLNSDMLKDYLERYYGSSNAQVDQSVLQREREVFLETLTRKMANEQLRASNPTNEGNFTRSMNENVPFSVLDRIRREVQESLKAIAESSAVEPTKGDNNQAMDPNTDSHLNKTTTKSLNSTKVSHTKHSSVQDVDDALAAESLNPDTLSTLPKSKETGAEEQEGNEEDIASRLRARRPYPNALAEAHSHRVAFAGLEEHFTKPQHSERALLQANSTARAWKPYRDHSVVFYQAKLEPSESLKKVVVNLNGDLQDPMDQSQLNARGSAIKSPSVSQSAQNREANLPEAKSVEARAQEALLLSNNRPSRSSTIVQPNASRSSKKPVERKEFDDLDEWLDDKDLLYELFPALKEKSAQDQGSASDSQTLPQLAERKSDMDDETAEYDDVIHSGEPTDLEELWPELYDQALMLDQLSRMKSPRQD